MIKNKNTVLFLGSILLILILIEYFSPKPTDWTPSFKGKDKIPFGSYVFKNILLDKFHKHQINTKSIFESSEEFESTNNFLFIQFENYSNYINPVNKVNSPDEESIIKLLAWIEQGNDAFISSIDKSSFLLDTLQIQMKTLYRSYYNYTQTFADSLSFEMNFYSPNLKNSENFKIKYGRYNNYYSINDSLDYKLISYFETKETKYPNFISIKHGNGTIYLNTLPYLYSNIGVLYEDRSFLQKSLSYFDFEKTLIFDDYYKIQKSNNLSPLRYINSQAAFNWAYKTLIFSSIILILFGVKRYQKPIPIMEEAKNSSLEFTTTLADLYLSKSSNDKIAKKKIKHYLEFLRSNLYLNTNIDSNELLNKTIIKTHFDEKKLKSIFYMIEKSKMDSAFNDDELIRLNTEIDEFYKKVK